MQTKRAPPPIILQRRVGRGRGLYSQRQIKRGETILEEEPLALVVKKPFQKLICHYCLGALSEESSAVACSDCSHAVFCSSVCKDNAFKEFHDVECKIKDESFHELEEEIRLIFRILLRFGKCAAANMKKEENGSNLLLIGNAWEKQATKQASVVDPESIPASKEVILSGANHSSPSDDTSDMGSGGSGDSPPTIPGTFIVHPLEMEEHVRCSVIASLQSHSAEFDQSLTDNLQAAVFSLFKLVRQAVPASLQETGYFTKANMFHTAAQLQTNAYAVFRVMSSTPTTTSTYREVQSTLGERKQVDNDNSSLFPVVSNSNLSQTRIAVGVFPVASMLNHSCAPNTALLYEGRRIIFKAATTINTGAEIFNCYGPQRGYMDTEERQRALLQQYHFECDCEACEALLDPYPFQCQKGASCEGELKLSPLTQIISCQTCHTICQREEWDKLELFQTRIGQLLQAADSILSGSAPDASSPETALSLLDKALEVSQVIHFKHNKSRAEVFDQRAKALCTLGRLHEALSEERKSVSILEVVLGKEHPALGREYIKLCMIAFLCLEQEQINSSDVSGGAVDEGKHRLVQTLKAMMTHLVAKAQPLLDLGGGSSDDIADLNRIKKVLQ